MKRILALLLTLLLVCPAVAEEAPLAGEIAEADKHGNVSTTLPLADLTARCELGDVLTVAIGGQTITAPFVTRYSDVNMGEPLVFATDTGYVAFAVNYGSFKELYAAEPGVGFTVSLLLKGGYRDQYEIRHLVKSESRDDYASDEVFANFRPVVDGVLYRGANPILADDARAPYVMALVKASGVRAVVNLAQTDEELAGNPYGELPYVAVGMSADVQSEEFVPSLRKAFEFIVSNDGPYFVHCNEGKDRAGIVCALLEGLLGFTPEQIVEDYMVSYVNYYGIETDTEKYALLSQQIGTIMETILGAPMNADTLQARVEAYLTNVVGVPADALRARLTK